MASVVPRVRREESGVSNVELGLGSVKCLV